MIVFDGFSAEYFPQKNTVEVRLPDGIKRNFTADELGVMLFFVREIVRKKVD